MGKGPAALGASILITPWTQSCPGGEEAPGTQDGVYPAQTCPDPIPAALSTPAQGGGPAETPPTPLGSAAGAHPSSSQRMLRDRGKKKSSGHLNPPHPAAPHGAGPPLPGPPGGFSLPSPGYSKQPEPSLGALPGLWGGVRPSYPGDFGWDSLLSRPKGRLFPVGLRGFVLPGVGRQQMEGAQHSGVFFLFHTLKR